MNKCWTNGGREPALWDVLAEPIVQKLMQADRVTRKDVLSACARPEEGAPAPERERLSA